MVKCLRKSLVAFVMIFVLHFLLILDHVSSSRSSALARSSHHHHSISSSSDSSSSNTDGAGRGSSHRKSNPIVLVHEKGSNRDEGPCRHIRCGAGRECRINESSGEAECGCMGKCRMEGKSNNKPVCGTDGRLYPSYCDLRRTACLTGVHISFSHYYQHEKHSYHPHHHHYNLHHQPPDFVNGQLEDDDETQLQTRSDFPFGVGGDGGNETTSYASHKQSNIISTQGASQDSECFPIFPLHHHHDHHRGRQGQQQHRNHHYHQHHHHHHHRSHEPDKNPLLDKESTFSQSRSALHKTSSPVVVGNEKAEFFPNEKETIASEDYDDDEVPQEFGEIYKDSPSPRLSMSGAPQTTSVPPIMASHQNSQDFDYEDDANDEVHEQNTRESKKHEQGRTMMKSDKGQQNRNHPNSFGGSHGDDGNGDGTTDTDYPDRSPTSGGQKEDRFSSNRKNELVDSPHIYKNGHRSHTFIKLPSPPHSSYYDFMEHSTDKDSGDANIPNPNEKWKPKGRMTTKEIRNEEKQHRWRKYEMSDQALPNKDGIPGQDADDGDDDDSLYEDDSKFIQTLDPSSAGQSTNPAWKLLQEKGEIRRNHDQDASQNTNGHLSRNDGRVKKNSSFFDEKQKDSGSGSSIGFESSLPSHHFHNNHHSIHHGRSSSKGFSSASTLSKHSQKQEHQQSAAAGNGGAGSGSSSSSSPTSFRHNVCSPEDYEILKGELFQYDIGKLMKHIKLMTSGSNEVLANGNDDASPSGHNTPDGSHTPWSDVMPATTSSPSSPLSISSTSSSSPWLNSMEGGSDGPEADKDNLLRHIFILLDRNHDKILEYVELYKAELENVLGLVSPEKTGCQFRDFLLYDDMDNDGQLHVNEFFSSFSHFYDITMISLDKALETKEIRVVEGESVQLQCDITGSPLPYIVWKRYGTPVSQMDHGIKTNIDGTLSLTNVHMIHAGHYSCHSPRNPEVLQLFQLNVETQPYVEITPKLSWKRPGEDLLLICRLVFPIMDSSLSTESATGQPSRRITWTWLFNGIPLKDLPKSDNNNHNTNNKYIFENSFSPSTTTASGSGSSITGDAEISRLRILDIYFQDMGTYACQAEISAGIGTATASLVVIDPNSKPEVQALHNTNARQLLVFHRNGLASYSAEHCGWLWEIFGDDVLQYSKGKDGARAVCDQFHSLCDWGNAVQVSPNFVFVSQPSLNRVLLIDVGVVQSVGNALATIETCANPTKLEYVPYTDQLWIRCENVESNRGKSLFNIVENVSKGDHHHLKAIQFPLELRDAPSSFLASDGSVSGGAPGPERITEIYLPSHQDGKRGRKDCQFAFVLSSYENQSLWRIDMRTFTYPKNSHLLNLTKFSCIPHQVHYSLSCTISIISCLDPQTRVPNGQVVVDILSNAVRFKTEEISGASIISPDNRILLTERHEGNETHVFVQRIGVYEINLVSHFLLSHNLTNVRIVHSAITGAYASIAKLMTGKEVILSLHTGEMQSIDELENMMPHSSLKSSIYPVDNAFPLKTDRSVIVMDAETLRPRCKFYEEIPELQSFLTVQS